MGSFSMEEIGLAAVGIAIVVYGVLVFRGNKRCFGVLPRGGDFLALDPSDDVFGKEARRSGAAICLVAVVIWGSVIGRSIQDSDALRMAMLVVVAVSVAAIAVLVILTAKTHFRLEKEQRERDR